MLIQAGRKRLIAKGLLLSLLLAPPILSAKLYKWVDENGEVHYSDKVPSQYQKGAHSELDKRGIQRKQVDAAKTKEEIAKEQELERLRAEQQRLIEEQWKEDQVLLRTFRSEDDILMTRNGSITAVDVTIQVTRSNIRRMKFKLAEMQQRAAQIERQGRAVSQKQLQSIESTRRQLKESYTAIIRQEQKKEVIRTKAASDLDRFRKLKKLNEENKSPVEELKPFSLLDTVVVCENDAQCDSAWKKAEKYVRKHASTRLQILSGSIIMTAAPVSDKEISLTVSRIIEKDQPGAKLFLDLQCRATKEGKALCATPEMEEIRMGFRTFLSEG